MRAGRDPHLGNNALMIAGAALEPMVALHSRIDLGWRRLTDAAAEDDLLDGCLNIFV